MQPHNQTSLQESGDKDIQISLFKHCKAISSTSIAIDRLLALISSGGGFKSIIEQLRASDNQAEKDELKKHLPAVTVSGLFGEARKQEHLLAYSGFMQVDLDKVENLAEIRAKLEKDKYSFAVFLSPSGNGIKIIVRVSNDLKKHLNSFLALESYYLSNYNLQIDKSCKDITRLMFLSWDENLFVNEKSIVFLEKELNEFEKAFNYLNRKEPFSKGNRNSFLFKWASLCSKGGISIDFFEKEIINRYSENDFPEKEIKNTIKSAYKNPSNAPKNKIENKIKEEKGYSKIIQVENFLNSKYEFRNNIVSNKIEFRKKEFEKTFSELKENNVYCDLSRNNLEVSLSKLSALLNSDFVSAFNPFITYFESLKIWDVKTQPDFIDKVCSYVPVKDEARFKKHFKKMLVRCIACALDDNIFNKQAFILVHDQQGSGKTSFCRWLCPPDLSDYIAENINTDKDSQIALATNFLINMDELSTMAKADINTLKSFISKDKINVRLPFDRRATVKPRRANFIGSTNKDEFLTDETGSVRWLCFELIAKINFAYKQEIEINDVWRQAYKLYKDGFQYQLSQEEIEENEAVNKQFTVTTAELDLIPKYFKPGTKEKHDEFATATDIQNHIAMATPHIKLSPYAIGKALKILGFSKSTHYNENTKQSIKGYYVVRLS